MERARDFTRAILPGLDGMVAAESAVRVNGPGRPSGGTSTVSPPHETPGGDMVSAAGLPVIPAPSRVDFTQRRKGANGTEAEERERQRVVRVCEEFAELVRRGYTRSQAGRMLGLVSAWWSGPGSVYGRWQRGEAAEGRRSDGRPAAAGSLTGRIEGLGWFIPAARYFNLNINRTKDSGSVAEAVRRAISLPVAPVGWTDLQVNRFLRVLGLDQLPECPAELRAEILGRERSGQGLVPGRVARQIAIGRAVTRFARNPKGMALDYVNAAGCSRFGRRDGRHVPLRSGERLQPDDGSINFCVCVPWEFPTDACSRRYGVLVGRFQLLLLVDAMSLAIVARSFVVRPRSSYRQEDALGLYNIFMRQHGVPAEIWHEGGVWNSGRVKDCLDLLGVRRHLVHSPHNKAAVEGRFNKLWTVLSGLSGGQIGRYRGEMERENALLASCKGGHQNPRKVFPSIEVALGAIDQAIEEANRTPVRTAVGTWAPQELLDEELGTRPLRPLEAGSEWMFAPYCVERVNASGINTKVPLFEDFSVPFTFAASWMPRYRGARMKAYFDPWTPHCIATVVLGQKWEGQKAGTILGTALQTNDIAEYARLMLGLGFGPSDAGRFMRQRQLAALRADRKAIVGGGRGLSVVEQRDGLVQRRRIMERGAGETHAQEPRREAEERVDMLAGRASACRPAEQDPALAEFMDADT